MRLLRPQLILSLCDHSGVWSQPYVDADYDVVRIDLKHGRDVRLMELPHRPVHGVLAAPPCTVFANSGARWPRSDQDMRDGLSVVDACCRIVLAACPAWWVLENPAGPAESLPGAAADDVPAQRLRRPVHEAHMPLGRVQHPSAHTGAGDRGLEDAPPRTERGPGRASERHARGVRAQLLRGQRMMMTPFASKTSAGTGCSPVCRRSRVATTTLEGRSRLGR